jgi:hypothetical protein
LMPISDPEMARKSVELDVPIQHLASHVIFKICVLV